MSQALIIDDNEFNIKILASFLADEGFDSITLKHPNQLDTALEQFVEPTIVFLDLEMPELDGFQVLEKIKDDPRFRDVPIIAHSVHISEIKVTHSAGFDGFIGKPLNADKFPQQLSRILNGKPVWETA